MKSYIDMQTQRGCVVIFSTDEAGNPKEIMQAGTTVCSMPSKYKDKYLKLEQNNKVFFIFDDCVPEINFYAVPRIDIFARDNQEGYFGTVGGTSDIDDLEAPICYIDKNKNIFKAANCMKEFIAFSGNRREHEKKELMSEVTLFSSVEEAKDKIDFIDIEQ